MGGQVVAAASSSSSMRSERKSPPPPKAAPWLVIPYGKSNRKNQALYNICEPNNKTLRKSIPELNGKTFKQKTSHQGWCIILCDEDDFDYTNQCWNYGDCFLWNPATLQTIELPSVLFYIENGKEYVYQDCVLSDAADNNSMVLFLFERKDKRYDHLLIYCFPGEKQWRTHKLARDMVDFEDVISVWYFKDKFYVTCLGNRHLEIETQKLGGDNNICFSIRPIEIADATCWPSIGGRDTTECSTQFVECGDELFKVVTTYPERGYRRVDIAMFVAKFDFNAMELKEVNSFGDHVLFVSDMSCVGCSAAQLGLPKGCLYYTLGEDQSLHKFEVESSGNSVILPCLKLPMTWYTSGWIMVQDKEDMLGKDRQLKAVLNNKTSGTGNCENEVPLQETLSIGPLQEEAFSWDALNEDLPGLVANYLHRLDYIHFRLVSRANLAVMPLANLTSTCTTNRCTTRLSPWLVFSRDKCHDVYSFVNPMHNNENYLMRLSDLVGAIIRFQKGGWLLMSKGLTSIFFYNPFTRQNINLPDLPVDMCGFSSISFSSSPTSSDCIVFAIQQMRASDGMSNEISIYFIRTGETLWSLCNFENMSTEKFTAPLHNTPVFCDGVLYCLDYNGTLGVLSLADYSWKVLEKPHQQFSGIYPSFLVECAGQILLVKLGHLGAPVGVFKLDFSKMVWDEVLNLGKQMLFISHTSCFSAIAPNRRMENKIYFPRLCLNGEGVLFYSLETGNYQSFGTQHSAKNFYDTEGWYTNCTWIEPNWSKA